MDSQPNVEGTLVVLVGPKGAGKTTIGGWLERAELRHYVAKRFPLERTVEAHAFMERGTIGNVLVDVAAD